MPGTPHRSHWEQNLAPHRSFPLIEGNPVGNQLCEYNHIAVFSERSPFTGFHCHLSVIRIWHRFGDLMIAEL